MKTISLAVAVLLAGCVTTGSRTTVTNELMKLPNKGEEISEREQQCVRQAVNRTNAQIAQIEATPNALTASRTRQAKDDGEVSRCIANADREKAQLSARERAEYDSEAQRERARAALMSVLTTSQPR